MPTKQEIADELAASKTKAELQAMADADNQEEAEAQQLDETVEGGRYKVGNEIVNAHGEKIR